MSWISGTQEDCEVPDGLLLGLLQLLALISFPAPLAEESCSPASVNSIGLIDLAAASSELIVRNPCA